MAFIVALGVGAGLVSALLLGTIAAGSLLGVLLFWLAPLPLIIVGLGWHWLVAALAALSAGFALSIGLNDKVAFSYMGMVGIPAMLIGWFAMRRRPVPAPDDASAEGQAAGWPGSGALIMLICVYTAAAVVIGAMLVDPSLAGLQARLAHSTELLLRLQLGIGPDAPLKLPSSGEDLSDLPRLYAMLAPSVGAVTMNLTLLLSLWLGAMVVRQSGRLQRPWPRLDETRLPFGAVALVALAAVLSQASGYAGMAGDVLMSLLLFAFALQGFATVHALTRGIGFRGPLLFGVWASVLMIGLPVLLIAGLGVADHIFNLRRRFQRPGGPA